MKKKIKKINLLKKIISGKHLPFIAGLILIFLTSFLLYHNLFNTFFTQDEWWELGRAVDARTQGIGYYFKPWGGHVVPLMLFFVNLQFRFFGTNIWPYAALAIFGHSLIAIILALFVAKLTKRLLIGWLSGFIFVVNTAPFEAVTYIAGGVTHIHGATVLFLVSLIFFARYLQSGSQRKYFFLSLLSIVLALAFSEYVSFYFFLVPVIYFIFYPRKKNLGFWIDQAILVSLGISFFVYRFLTQKINIYGSQFIGNRTFEDASLKVNQPVLDYFAAVLASTAKLLPRVFYQVWMTEDMLDKIPRSFGSMANFLTKMPLYMIGLILITFLILYILRQRFLMKLAVVAVLLLVMGAFPAYIFPTAVNVIPSRYLYLSSLGFSVLFCFLLTSVAQLVTNMFSDKRKVIVYIFILGLALTPFFLKNYNHINKRLRSTVIVSKMRQKILKQAMDYYPQVKPKTIFFSATNLRTPGIPWPVHLGYSLLVMYTYQGNYQGSEKFFRSNKLWPVSEEYEDFGDIGFGHFHTFGALLETLKRYKLTEDNVYGLYWQATLDSKRNLEVTHEFPPIYDGELLDITGEIRPAIKKLLESDKYAQLEQEIGKSVFPEIKLSFDRSSEATFLNQRGLVETAEYGIPRLTNGGQGKNLGVLIEGYSANLLRFSEQFDNSLWGKSSGVKVKADSAIAPDGNQKADELFFEQGSDSLLQKVEYPVTNKGEGDYTFSVYLKSSVSKSINLFIEGDERNSAEEKVTIDSSWRRFQTTAKLKIGGPIRVGVTGATGELLAWGSQLEEYPYATSYIKTQDKVKFRTGDVFRAYSQKSIPMAQGTIGFWVKPEWSKSSTLGHMLFYNGDDPSRNSIGIDASTKMLRLVLVDEKGKQKRVDYELGYEAFQRQGWNHIVATWSKGVLRLYLNGQSVGKAVGEGSGVFDKKLTFAWPYRVGIHHGWYSLQADAIISNIQLQPRALNAQEILGLYLVQKSNYN